MRIGIDARLWGEEENKGLGRYVKELVLNLEKVAKQDDEFFIFLRKNNFSQYQPKNHHFSKRLWDVRWYTLKEQINFLPLLKEKLDLIHFPHFNIPFFYPFPFVVTIHDLIILESSRQREVTTLSFLEYTLKFLGCQLILEQAMKRAKKIITVSETTKKDILKHYPPLQNKIKVIYPGLNEFSISPNQLFLKKEINKPYLLYVGSAYPHKNLKFLIQGFLEFIKEEEQTNLQLVLVGKKDYFYQKLEKELSPLPQDVIFYGQVSDSELKILYQNALLFVSASLKEGFGLPPLEAALQGTPSLLSDIEAFHETLSKNALYFNPFQIRDFKNKLKIALEKINQYDKIVPAKEELLKKFNWQICAKETLELYHQSL
jgi:glycosyltransferase involved in cell wall biosynthesis